MRKVYLQNSFIFMKKAVISMLLLSTIVLAYGRKLHLRFSYDAAGNRIERKVDTTAIRSDIDTLKILY